MTGIEPAYLGLSAFACPVGYTSHGSRSSLVTLGNPARKNREQYRRLFVQCLDVGSHPHLRMIRSYVASKLGSAPVRMVAVGSVITGPFVATSLYLIQPAEVLRKMCTGWAGVCPALEAGSTCKVALRFYAGPSSLGGNYIQRVGTWPNRE